MLRNAYISSFVLHLIILLIMFFGLPSFFKKKDMQPIVVSVDVVPVSSITNIKTKKPKMPLENEGNKTKIVPKNEEKVEDKSEDKKSENVEKKNIDELKKLDEVKEKKPEIKKEEKKEVKKSKPSTDLNSLLKNLEESSVKSDEKRKNKVFEEAEDDEKTSAKSDKYDETQPLSMTELDAIRSQIASCWSIPAGAKDVEQMSVVLKISIDLDGTVSNVAIAEKKSAITVNEFYQVFIDSAIRAVKKCSPLKNLNPERYNSWKAIELNFDPSEMF